MGKVFRLYHENVVFIFLSLAGVFVASYRVLDVPIHVDTSNYLYKGGFFEIQEEQNLLNGFLQDSSYLISHLILCQPSDTFVPLFVFWAKEVLRWTGSFLAAAHIPQTFWHGLFPGLLAFWLHRGPLRLSFTMSILASWLVLWNSYLLAVSRIGWVQPSALTWMLLHLLAVNRYFSQDESAGFDKKFTLPLITSLLTCMGMVLQHPYSLFLCLTLLLFFCATDGWSQTIKPYSRTGRYFITILPAFLVALRMRKCISHAREFIHSDWTPLSDLWGAFLQQNGSSPFVAFGWELTLPGMLGIGLAMFHKNGRFLLPLLYLLIHTVGILTFYRAPHYRMWAPAVPVFAIAAAYAFDFVTTKLGTWKSTASVLFLVFYVFLLPLRTYHSLFAEKLSVLTNPTAWSLYGGGSSTPLFRDFFRKLSKVENKNEPIFILHNYAGLLYAGEANIPSVWAEENDLIAKRPHAFIATDYAWSNKNLFSQLQQDYQKMASDGGALHLFVLKNKL